MRPSDIWKRLPTVNEILDKPQVRAVLDRVPVREVTERTRRFLDGVYQEVRRRSDDFTIPSIAELADRAARFLLHDREASPHVTINATGRMWSAELPSPPLAAAAARGVAVMTEGYWIENASRDEAEHRLAEAAGAEAAILTASHASALALALATASQRSVGIARGDVGTLLEGSRVADLAALAGCRLVELGASDCVTHSDFEHALQTDLAAIVHVELPSSATRSSRVDYEHVNHAAHARGAIVIHDIASEPLAVPQTASDWPLLAATQVIAAGADLVVVRGNGWFGGPECGIIVGRRELVDRAREHTLAGATRASGLTVAALLGVLDAGDDAAEAPINHPVLALATAPLANLKTRAERLAPQIAAQPDVESAAVVDIAEAHVPLSVGVEVVPTVAGRERLAKQLATSNPSVRYLDQHSKWLFDLRTVAASQDIALVAAFQGLPEAGAGPSDDQSPQPATP